MLSSNLFYADKRRDAGGARTKPLGTSHKRSRLRHPGTNSAQTFFTFLKNGPSPASFLVVFLSFLSKYYNFTTNDCEKLPSSLQYWDSNP